MSSTLIKVGKLSDKAKLSIELSTCAINAYEGAVRSSKTFTTILKWIRYCIHGPPGNLVMVGRTERTIERNIIDVLKALLGPSRCTYNRGTGEMQLCGRTVQIAGANNEAARTKIQGSTYAGAYVDEAGTIPESFFNMLTTRLSIDGAQLWLTANPEGKKHWLKVNWLDKAKVWLKLDGTVARNADGIDLARFTFGIDDNPHLSAGFVARLKKQYTGVWYRRFILSEWTNAEGAIYDMWDEDTMSIPWSKLPVMKRLIGCGFDYGTTNASAGGVLGWGVDDKLYICDEWRHNNTKDGSSWTDAQLSAGFRHYLEQPHTPYDNEPKVEWIFVDPAAASFKTQLFYDGLNNVANADNDVLTGIRTVASLLSTGKLLIAGDKCPGLLDELPEYSWDKVSAEKGIDKPKKVDDHSLDGTLRYSVQSTRSFWAPTLLGDLANVR
jgi:PBSX family phage terminase large subunit